MAVGDPPPPWSSRFLRAPTAGLLAALACRPARGLPRRVQQRRRLRRVPTASGKFGDKPKITVDEGQQGGEDPRVGRPRRGQRPDRGEGRPAGRRLPRSRRTATRRSSTTPTTGRSPAAFPIGTGSVIPGLGQGLVGAKIGSRVVMGVPPSRATASRATRRPASRAPTRWSSSSTSSPATPRRRPRRRPRRSPACPAGLPTVKGDPAPSRPSPSRAARPRRGAKADGARKGTGRRSPRASWRSVEYAARRLGTGKALGELVGAGCRRA